MRLRTHLRVLLTCVGLLTFLLTLGATVSCGSRGHTDPIELDTPALDFWELPHDEFEPAPVEIHIEVYFNVRLELVSAWVDWGDDEGSENVELPLNASGYFEAREGSTLRLTHVYAESGEYAMDFRATDRTGKEHSRGGPLTLRIGPERRMFTDPRDGSTYEIYDGTVWVTFADGERLSQLDHDMAEEPDIAAFLEAENVRVRQEQAVVASMEVILPGGGTTVEEAVGEWPERYPDLIEAVDPNAISELH